MSRETRFGNLNKKNIYIYALDSPFEIIWHIVFIEIFVREYIFTHFQVCVEKWHISQTQEILREDWCALNWLLSSSIGLPEAAYRFPPRGFPCVQRVRSPLSSRVPPKPSSRRRILLFHPHRDDGTPTAFRATSQFAIFRNSAPRSAPPPPLTSC